MPHNLVMPDICSCFWAYVWTIHPRSRYEGSATVFADSRYAYRRLDSKFARNFTRCLRVLKQPSAGCIANDKTSTIMLTDCL